MKPIDMTVGLSRMTDGKRFARRMHQTIVHHVRMADRQSADTPPLLQARSVVARLLRRAGITEHQAILRAPAIDHTYSRKTVGSYVPTLPNQTEVVEDYYRTYHVLPVSLLAVFVVEVKSVNPGQRGDMQVAVARACRALGYRPSEGSRCVDAAGFHFLIPTPGQGEFSRTCVVVRFVNSDDMNWHWPIRR